MATSKKKSPSGNLSEAAKKATLAGSDAVRKVAGKPKRPGGKSPAGNLSEAGKKAVRGVTGAAKKAVKKVTKKPAKKSGGSK